MIEAAAPAGTITQVCKRPRTRGLCDFHGPVSRQEQCLSQRVAGLDAAVRLGRLDQRERLPDDWLEPSGRYLGQGLFHQWRKVGRVELHLLDSPQGHRSPPGLSRVDLGKGTTRS